MPNVLLGCGLGVLLLQHGFAVLNGFQQLLGCGVLLARCQAGVFFMSCLGSCNSPSLSGLFSLSFFCCICVCFCCLSRLVCLCATCL